MNTKESTRTTTWTALIVVALLCLTGTAAAEPKTLPPPDLFVLDDGSGSIIRITADGAMWVWKTTDKIRSITGKKGVEFRDVGAATDGLGNLYFTEGKSEDVLKYDYVHGLELLTERKAIRKETGSGTSPRKIAFGADGFLYVQDPGTDSILRIDPDTGEVTLFADDDTLESLPGIAFVDPDGGITESGGLLYFASDGTPDGVFSLDPDGNPATVSTDGAFTDLDSYMTTAPNGDLIVINNDQFDDDYAIYRITPDGDVSVLLSKADIEAVTGGSVDLSGGISFGRDGSLYLAERSTNTIYRFDADGTGTVFVSAADFESLTGSAPRLRGAIIWAAVPSPEPGTIALVALGAGALVWHRRRRRRRPA